MPARDIKIKKQDLIHKIQFLPQGKLAEVEDFVDFLFQRDNDRHLIKAASKTSEKVFEKIWDNTEDSAYDKL